ncbi:MAG: hypothetical protein ACXVXZ_13495 [Mycobacteriaceae bacterium]
MTPPASSPNLPPDVQRQANDYHQAAAVERHRANHHQADLNRVAAAELEARAAQDLPELPAGTASAEEAQRPTADRAPSDRPTATVLLPERSRVPEGDRPPGATTVPEHTVGYQDLGDDVLEIAVGGQPTLGTVSSVGETDWVAINRLGTVLGYHPSRAMAAAAVGKEWETRSRSVRLGRHAEAAMAPRS